jgi:hypothetical protein
MSNIGKYYNYLSLSETMTTSSFSKGNKEEDKYSPYSPYGMFNANATQTARSTDGGDWSRRNTVDDDDEDDLEPDPSSGDIPVRPEDLWDYVDWWESQLPQYQGAANTISRLMVQPSMSSQDWYDFFYELLGFGHNGADGPILK